MTPERLRKLLTDVQQGGTDVEHAMRQLELLPFEGLEYAHVDHHRSLRCGFPEVIFCQGKTAEQVAGIFLKVAAGGGNVLATRATAEQFEAVKEGCAGATFHPTARCITFRPAPCPASEGIIALVCAGTSDLPVIEEARVTCEIMDQRTQAFHDVGVAGIHRLLSKSKELREARVVIVAAGMEGALPSVVGGLVSAPVIAVPTSVGYGASFQGIAPLLAMLNSCASGVGVVNIDNGFGAGALATKINRLGERQSA